MHAVPAAPWSPLADSWEDLFPLRPPRLDLALRLAGEGTRTLDAGCATGALPRALAAQGRRAEGLDLEPAFLEVARRRSEAEGLDIPWRCGDLLEMGRLAGRGRYQLITCLGQTLPHLLEEDQWLEFFRQARELLLPGGHLVIQALNDTSLPSEAWRELAPLEVAAGRLERRRRALGADRALFETVFTPRQGSPIHGQAHHRRIAPGAAAALLQRAGLDPAPPMADEGGQAFQPQSPGWVLVAQAPPSKGGEPLP